MNNHQNQLRIEKQVNAIFSLYSQEVTPGDDTFSLDKLREIYTDDAVFEDPVHRCEGIEALRDYANAIYGGVTACRFDHQGLWIHDEMVFTRWTMTLCHPSLNGGKPFSLEGISQLQCGERIHYHRDFYDIGAMFYEKVPVIGPLNRWLKRRLTP